ncbi:hypothetical protein TH19_06100 [Thalassospira profundimaris]|uniref:Uncharacterized protein n=1 Tax=Thalassospira profundimaris TaxID=502049 RepID=A0A367WD21_9PROT|nr:hypothetical protein TH19_06100 [Thalassospira profundimaris]
MRIFVRISYFCSVMQVVFYPTQKIFSCANGETNLLILAKYAYASPCNIKIGEKTALIIKAKGGSRPHVVLPISDFLGRKTNDFF